MIDLGIKRKVKEIIDNSQFDALLVFGSDHVHYLSGVVLPFLPYRYDQTVAVIWPRTGDPAIICPVEFVETVRQSGRIERVIGYCSSTDYATVAHTVATALNELVSAGTTIGVDTMRASAGLHSALAAELNEFELVSCDTFITSLRMIKTPEEIELLEDVAYRTDHGVNGLFHHIIVHAPPRSLLTAAEDVRVHCMERGLNMVGYNCCSQVAAAEYATTFWHQCPINGHNYGYSSITKLAPGQMVRFGIRTSDEGYWSDSSRILVMGEPTPDQTRIYNRLVGLRDVAVEGLVPGARCCDVYRAVADAANKARTDLISELGIGHGVGVTAYEPPYLTEDDETVLQAGMVLVVDLAVRDQNNEIMRTKDTVVITEGGCRIVGWWKDWREPYIPIAAI